MKPQEFIDKWIGWAKNKEDINDEILADLDAMNQALRIHDVVSSAFDCYPCDNCGRMRNDKPCIVCGSD